MTPLLLAVLAVVLAGPAPALLARLPVLRRTPRAAMVLWQAVALAAVLAALGAGLALVTDHAWREEEGLLGWLVAGSALVVTGLVLARLLSTGDRIGRSLRVHRRRHREQVDLLARRVDGLAVLDHDVPVAYCLPGVTRSRVVVSQGALGSLAPDELSAVVAHERAHLRARHDLVVEAFSVLHAAFPRLVSSAAALTEVRLLVEILADRAAVRTVGRLPLLRALVALAGSRPPIAEGGVALGAGGGQLGTRARLLQDPRAHRVQAAALLLAAAAVVVLPTVFLAAPWLLSLRG